MSDDIRHPPAALRAALLALRAAYWARLALTGNNNPAVSEADRDYVAVHAAVLALLGTPRMPEGMYGAWVSAPVPHYVYWQTVQAWVAEMCGAVRRDVYPTVLPPGTTVSRTDLRGWGAEGQWGHDHAWRVDVDVAIATCLIDGVLVYNPAADTYTWRGINPAPTQTQEP